MRGCDCVDDVYRATRDSTAGVAPPSLRMLAAHCSSSTIRTMISPRVRRQSDPRPSVAPWPFIRGCNRSDGGCFVNRTWSPASTSVRLLEHRPATSCGCTRIARRPRWRRDRRDPDAGAASRDVRIRTRGPECGLLDHPAGAYPHGAEIGRARGPAIWRCATRPWRNGTRSPPQRARVRKGVEVRLLSQPHRTAAIGSRPWRRAPNKGWRRSRRGSAAIRATALCTRRGSSSRAPSPPRRRRRSLPGPATCRAHRRRRRSGSRTAAAIRPSPTTRPTSAGSPSPSTSPTAPAPTSSPRPSPASRSRTRRGSSRR